MFNYWLFYNRTMSNMTPKQQTLVKARKASRTIFALLLFGGAILLLYGILTSYLPTVLDGVVLFASSLLPYVLSKLIEKKLNLPSV
jgi:hypothetical protein